MEKNEIITIEQICAGYGVEFSFIEELEERGLIRVLRIENSACLEPEQLLQFEKMMRLHYDLGINFEGLEVVENLLERIESMQSELRRLRRMTEQS